MLTGNEELPPKFKYYAFFQSPYQDGLENPQAGQYMSFFLRALSELIPSKFYVLKTNFLYHKYDQNRDENHSNYYFCDWSDSATLMIREDHKAFLILTNGMAS